MMTCDLVQPQRAEPDNQRVRYYLGSVYAQTQEYAKVRGGNRVRVLEASVSRSA